MPEIGPVDETTFCQLDCKFRDDPKSITEDEIGLLLERGREEHWQEYFNEQEVNCEESYEEGYAIGYDDCTKAKEMEDD